MSKIPLSEFGHLELINYFEYLDALRESGATNMLGAGSFLQEEHRSLLSCSSCNEGGSRCL